MTVLLVEEAPEDLDGLRASLRGVRGEDVELEHAGELSDALQRLSEGGVDAVLLDLTLPDSQGMVTFERMYAFAPDIPIVVLTALDDEEVAVATVQGGAQDYLVRDEVTPAEVVRALRYAMERHRLLSALRTLSLLDDLTGLYNRRGFAELAVHYLKLGRRSGRGGTIFVLDLDRFKTINDTLGHHVGDRALLRVAEILRSVFRRSDLLARLQGDEFAVLALGSTEDGAEGLEARIREEIQEFNAQRREAYRLSASIGMVPFMDEDGRQIDQLITRAREAVQDEKRRRAPVA
ncbi:MAG TPA: GGDEF domain-containing response regulator [Longimicrobiales bacterium]|jgi:diguanylate cyclase (GGDEF)-like protein